MASSDENERDLEYLADQIAGKFVHRFFPNYCRPAYLACPDDKCVEVSIAAIIHAAANRDVPTEVVDLRPAPRERLAGVTARLNGFRDTQASLAHKLAGLLILEGFDLLEGTRNDAPTYPFRSLFQFDEEHVWLFVGRDWKRLSRMFRDHRLPLYLAAIDITPEPWRPAADPK